MSLQLKQFYDSTKFHPFSVFCLCLVFFFPWLKQFLSHFRFFCVADRVKVYTNQNKTR